MMISLFPLTIAAMTMAGPLPRPVEPSPVLHIENESVKLAATPGNKWAGGTPLAYARSGDTPGRGLPMPHALNTRTLTVRSTDGRILNPGTDYIVNGIYSTLSLGPAPSISSTDTVNVTYDVGRRRLASVIRQPDGKLILRQGTPNLTTAAPPPPLPGEICVGNYFLDFFQKPEEADWFPITATATEAPTRTASRGLERTLKKLREGQPVRIVCWGDSITYGGDASAPDKRYPAVFATLLRERFPSAQIEVTPVAVGGSQSRQWLHPEKFPHPTAPLACRFERVVENKPDLVTVEFLNDTWMPARHVNEVYSEIRDRLHAAGCDVLFITPNFTMPEMMGTPDLRAPDNRPYVLALKTFAETNGLALADVSARWEHLWREGLPYIVLLKNGINHPEDRGYAIYADELLKCFPLR
ncbi:SGNH/GDSL hydrolase family protein [Opitutaceae bacterium TAV4]|nr:SGNH/GDSL hydrolase family protein [Opitutaceae bacterium TAV4]RRK02230.1 SGNH/GDSL hydrolase family protein [Opitutaceae bacterium TAV3]